MLVSIEFIGCKSRSGRVDLKRSGFRFDLRDLFLTGFKMFVRGFEEILEDLSFEKILKSPFCHPPR